MSLDVQPAQAHEQGQEKELGLEATMLDLEPVAIAEPRAGLETHVGL
jgi:hypothetical protein